MPSRSARPIGVDVPGRPLAARQLRRRRARRRSRPTSRSLARSNMTRSRGAPGSARTCGGAGCPRGWRPRSRARRVPSTTSVMCPVSGANSSSSTSTSMSTSGGKLDQRRHVLDDRGDLRRVVRDSVNGSGVTVTRVTSAGASPAPTRRARPSPSRPSRAPPRSTRGRASASESFSSSVKPASSRKLRASWIGFSSSSPRKPPRLKSVSTVRWNSSARSRRSGSFSVRRRSQSEPIFTWVTSSASIQSSQNSSTGSPDSSPNSFIVLNTSIARPSSARFTPQRRSTGSGLHAAA